MNALLFAFGFLVTIVAFGAVGGIWWAALRDGQTHDAIKRGEQTGLHGAAPSPPRNPSAERTPGPAWQAGDAPATPDRPVGQTTAVPAPDTRL